MLFVQWLLKNYSKKQSASCAKLKNYATADVLVREADELREQTPQRVKEIAATQRKKAGEMRDTAKQMTDTARARRSRCF
jgi:hypothetical protein